MDDLQYGTEKFLRSCSSYRTAATTVFPLEVQFFNVFGAVIRDIWRCTTSPSGHKAFSSLVNGASKAIVLVVSIK